MGAAHSKKEQTRKCYTWVQGGFDDEATTKKNRSRSGLRLWRPEVAWDFDWLKVEKRGKEGQATQDRK